MGLLVLKRRVGGTVYVGDDIRIVVTEISGDAVRIGFDVPRHIPIVRDDAGERRPRGRGPGGEPA